MIGNLFETDRVAVERLTEGQQTCLRLVYRMQSSKQIARTLGISRHTVDQRVTLACRRLGVTTRAEAALIVADYDRMVAPDRIDLSAAALAVAPSDPPAMPQLAAAEHDDATSVYELESTDHSLSRSARRATLRLPLPDGKEAENDLTIAARLSWILAICGFATIVFGVLLASLAALARLLW